MKVLRFLRRRRESHTSVPAIDRRTMRRIVAVVRAVVASEGEDFSAEELAAMTGQDLTGIHIVLYRMESAGLARSYFPEPPTSRGHAAKRYSLTAKAFRWATEALVIDRGGGSGE